jgi:hypothetical protein
VCLAVLCAAACSVAVAQAATPGTPLTPGAPATPGVPGDDRGVATGVFTPMVTAPATAEVVTVGMYLVNIYGVDFESNTCYLTAYIWLTWKGDTDPTTSL